MHEVKYSIILKLLFVSGIFPIITSIYFMLYNNKTTSIIMLFFFVPLSLIATGMYLILDHSRYIKASIKCIGKISRIVLDSGQDGSNYVIHYKYTYLNKEFNNQTNVLFKYLWKNKQTICIYIHPDYPGNARPYNLGFLVANYISVIMGFLLLILFSTLLYKYN